MTPHAKIRNSTQNAFSAAAIGLFGAVALWVFLVIALAAAGTFDVAADEMALPTLLAVTIPVALFAAAMAASPRLRSLVLGIDPVLLTQMQAWRILGGLFLVVYAFNELPGFFAIPAGLGDVAIGVAAPFVAWTVMRDSSYIRNKRYRLFHYLGLFDFAIAISTGLAARNEIPGLVGNVTTAAMGELPLVLIPGLAVPAFIILHLIALLQSYRHGARPQH